jgi:histidinol-phosphate/aromatic aminotransferase/cobyric acid decarboxylase-like protein
MSRLRRSTRTPPPARPALFQIEPVAHGGAEPATEAPVVVRADFSTGVNAFGPAPIVLDALRRADPAAYPDPYCRLARKAASRWTGRPLEEILVGAGTAELVFAAAQAFVRPGDLVLIPEPAFGEYQRAARLAGARVCGPRFDGDTGARREDAEAFCRIVHRQRPRMAFLASPESATGIVLDPELLTRMAETCQRVGTLLVLDQAYDAFTRRPLGTPALPGHAAVLHLRSLTKDHALAGIRVGLAIGPPAVIDAVARVRPPWTASSLAQAAVAAASTEEARRHVAETTAALLDEASALAADCAGLGIRPMTSATHYFLAEVGDADRVARRLLDDHALRVRSATAFGFPNCVRIAARRPEDNALLPAALRQVAAAPTTEMSHVRPH